MYKCRRGVWRLGGSRVVEVTHTAGFQKTPKRYEIGCQLLLITNRKSHTGFRLTPTSVTLNDLEQRNGPYFAFFFIEFDIFSGRLCHSG